MNPPPLNCLRPAHPALLLVANQDGTPKLAPDEYRVMDDLVYGDILDLDPGTLLPTWVPWKDEDGKGMTYQERLEAFRDVFSSILRSRGLSQSDAATPTEKALTPEAVLSALRFLRSVLHSI